MMEEQRKLVDAQERELLAFNQLPDNLASKRERQQWLPA